MTEILLKRELEPLARQRQRFKLLIALAVSWCVVAAVAFGAFIVSRYFLPLAPTLLITGVVVLAIIAYAISSKIVNRSAPDFRDLARKIETDKPDLHTLLLTAVEQERDEKTGRLGYLQERLIGDALGAIRQEQNLHVVPRSRMLFANAIHLVALIILALVLFKVPGGPQSSALLANSAASASRAKSNVTVTPGDALVEKGSALVVLAKFDGVVPPGATLVVTTNGGTAQRIPLAKNLNDPVFGASIAEVRGPLTYRVEFGEEQTPEFKVTVFEHPRLERADAQITYPTYTELPTKRIEDTKRISAVEGSTVDFDFQLNKPVASARLVAKDQTILPVDIETNKAQAHLKAYKLETSQSYELQLVDADGRSNKLVTTFVFDVLTNGRPTLKFIAPRGDQRVSPLQEMLFSAEAQDDFGLRDHGLSYSVGGGELTTFVAGTNAPAKVKTNFTHLLKLEELRAQPDQLVSYFIWADDVGPDGQIRRTSSDMYFAEVRAFEEIFREAESMTGEQQQQQQQQQRQNQATKLVELQKQIINATWKLQRQETSPKPSAQYLTDEPVVRDSQASAIEQAQGMEEEAQDVRAKEALQSALKHMDAALEQLNNATNSLSPLPKALAEEQAAFQDLLKLQAREFQVAKAQKQQGPPQKQESQRNQSQIDQLDLKQEENRYETERQATAPQQDAAKQEQLEQINRLKELAQRQQDINEKLKELQTALQEAKTEKEKEDLQRELKRLREEQREQLADMDELKQRMEAQKGEQAQSKEAQQQLDQARQEAQKASEAMEKGQVSQALASGTRAERDLEKMRDEARKKNSNQFSEEMKQMRNDARDLAEKQDEIKKKLDETVNQPKALSDSGEAQKLAEQLAQQKQGVTNLLDQMKKVSAQSENVEPLLSKQLYDSLRKNSQGNLVQSLAASEELLKRNFTREAQQFEQRANKDIQNLKQDVERAAESVLGDETEALRAAKRELDALTQQLQSELARAMATNAAASNALAAATRGMGTNGLAGARGTNGPSASGMNTNALAGTRGTNASPGSGRNTNTIAGLRGTNAVPGMNTNGLAGGSGGTNMQAGAGQGTNSQQLASAQQNGQPGNPQGNQPNQNSGQQGQGQPSDQASAQPGQQPGAQQGQPGQQGQQAQAQQGQQGQQGQGQQGQQPGQQQGQQGQQGQGQQQAQAQQGQGQQGQGQQGQQPGQQPGQPGQGQGQGQGQAQQPQQANAQNPGEPQPGQPPQGEQPPNQNPGRGRNGQRATQLANMFNQPGSGPRQGDRADSETGPLLGEDDFSDWSKRLSNVEEMLDKPELRNQVAQARDRARATRSEFKRNNKPPQWDMVQKDILKPLVEVRERLADELSRRDSKDSLAPIDRDPVPNKYSDLVKRYYEKLGTGQ